MKTNRHADLAKIHLAKKDLQIDDEQYRDILWTLARVRSAADLDPSGRAKVLAYFRQLGWKAKPGKRGQGRPANIAASEQLQKIEALLTDMRLPWDYADNMAKHMYQVDKVGWLKETKHLQGIITALVKKQRKQKTQDNADKPAQ